MHWRSTRRRSPATGLMPISSRPERSLKRCLRRTRPGALHYLIHSYDYTQLAQRGLAAANKYASIAPDAPHALHMPAHTYSMLGLWAQSVESNTRSRASAQAQAARLWPGAAHPAEPHHLDFMEYALLQMGQETRAMTAPRSRSSVSNIWWATPGSPRSPHALPWNARLGGKPRRLSRAEANIRKPR